MADQMALFTDKAFEPSPMEREFFETPSGIAHYGIAHVASLKKNPLILDPGAGSGKWGHAARRRWPDAWIVGVDLPGVSRPPYYDRWIEADYLSWDPPVNYDVIIGNPPFSKAESFIRHSLPLLAEHGTLVLMLRLGFLASQARGAGLWQEYPPKGVAVSSRRPSFTGNGITDPRTDYAVYFWQRGYRGGTLLMPPFDYHQWES